MNDLAPGLAEDITLTETLKMAVPMWMAQLEHVQEIPSYMTADDIRNLGTYGTGLMFHRHGESTRSERRSSTLAFNSLARGLAVLARLEGGVTFAGVHWCAKPHEGCPRVERVREPVTAEEIARVVAMLDEFEELLKKER